MKNLHAADRRRLITRSEIKRRFHLTDGQLHQLGPPDLTYQNPRQAGGHPLRLYDPRRVERWITENLGSDTLLAECTPEDKVRGGLLALLQDFKANTAAGDPHEAALAHYRQDPAFIGQVSPRALFLFTRDHRTNAMRLLRAGYWLAGPGMWYYHLKMALTCRVLRAFSLPLAPAFAAFGDEQDTRHIDITEPAILRAMRDGTPDKETKRIVRGFTG